MGPCAWIRSAPTPQILLAHRCWRRPSRPSPTGPPNVAKSHFSPQQNTRPPRKPSGRVDTYELVYRRTQHRQMSTTYTRHTTTTTEKQTTQLSLRVHQRN